MNHPLCELAANVTLSADEPKPVTRLELVGYDHVALTIKDLQRSADWYKLVFDFDVLHKWTNTWMVGHGNMKIGLFQRPNGALVEDLDSKIAIQHVAFLVDGDKFAAAQEAIKKRGVSMEGPEDTGIALSIFFNDPDGHILELTTYHA